MLLRQKKVALSLLLSFASVICSSIPAIAQVTTKNDIIYEYDIITQKKGQSFKSALQASNLSDQQRKLLLTLPVLYHVDNERYFRIAYAIKKGKRLIREVKVTRGNRMANFALLNQGGQTKFVSQPSRIPPKALKQSAMPANPSQTVMPLHTKTPLFAYKTPQAKGQSLDDALRPLRLSKLQVHIINSGDFRKSAVSNRHLTLYFSGKKHAKLLRGLRVSRAGHRVHYVVENQSGKFALRNTKTLTASQRESVLTTFAHAKLYVFKAAKSKIKLTSITPAQKHHSNEAWFSQRVSQSKGQRLDNALRPLQLRTLQRNIIDSGDFLKSALSKRYLTLYFAGNTKQKLLRGLRVSRGNQQVNYVVEKRGKHFKLTNLKTLDNETRKNVLTQFARAKARASQKHMMPITPQKRSVVDSGSYRLMRITQAKGKSLSSAMVGFSLSQKQRELIRDIPVIRHAKSTRYFYVLFEKKGQRKYLKAARVVRGKNVSSFVLTRYRGRWTWANHKGQIKTGEKFLRYPLNFRRISSGFNLRRRHPITHRIRPHKGTDFAAPHGTPIWAPADGVVTFAGRQRGYGIILELDHGNGYTTKYAHLSRIVRGIRKGKRVKQRQLIARVGNTGLSTGAHLHYEVHVNGRARNPVTVRLPGGGGNKTLKSTKQAAAKYLPQLRRMM